MLYWENFKRCRVSNFFENDFIFERFGDIRLGIVLLWFVFDKLLDGFYEL